MAVAVTAVGAESVPADRESRVRLTKPKRIRPVRALPPAERFALTRLWLWTGHDYALRSTHGAMVDRLCGISGGGDGRDEDGLLPAERWCQRSVGNKRMWSARDALVEMIDRGQSLYVAALYAAIGPRRPNLRYDVWGELAGVVELTHAFRVFATNVGAETKTEAMAILLRPSAKRGRAETAADYARRAAKHAQTRAESIRSMATAAETLLARACGAYLLARAVGRR